MDRLTLPDKRIDENTVLRCLVDAEAVREHAMDIYWRLKAYEDTDLTPEMVIEMRDDALAINKELEEYKATGLTPEEIYDLGSMREMPPEAQYAITQYADSIIERLDKLLRATEANG